MGRGHVACGILLLAAACGGGGGGGGDDDGPGGDDPDAGAIEPPGEACSPPLEPYDTSATDAVIGTGSADSCTFEDLRDAAEQGGVITFDCGDAPVTIDVTEEIVLPVDTDTIIDGGGLVTLDAGGGSRIFYFDHPSWLDNETRFVVQGLRLVNGAAPLGEYFEQDDGNPECAYGYKEGAGGAIYMRNGVLHVIDSEFVDNTAALVGPDVGGGAIYVFGVPELVVQGSRFRGNRGSNGGAIGLLFANRAQLVNNELEDNTAEGLGANGYMEGCPDFNHEGQSGAGGNGGAVVFDGLNADDEVYLHCGNTFRNNRANALAGALFRTPNAAVLRMTIDRCLFDGNTAQLGGVSFIMQNELTVRATTFTGNRGAVNIDGDPVDGVFGALWLSDGTTLELENSTFDDNQPSALDVFNGAANTVRNVTFVASRPNGDLTIDNSLFVDTGCGDALPGADNLQWPAGGDCAGGTTIGDPELGELADNGGQTPTRLPSASGAAAGVAHDCPDTDQRGEPRDAATCAAGAVEP